LEEVETSAIETTIKPDVEEIEEDVTSKPVSVAVVDMESTTVILVENDTTANSAVGFLTLHILLYKMLKLLILD